MLHCAERVFKFSLGSCGKVLHGLWRWVCHEGADCGLVPIHLLRLKVSVENCVAVLQGLFSSSDVPQLFEDVGSLVFGEHGDCSGQQSPGKLGGFEVHVY